MSAYSQSPRVGWIRFPGSRRFNTALRQYAYLRMGMGLTGGPATYSRLKDISTGRIPKLNLKLALDKVC